jgi:FlaA1/EpsC-like NDP-sugar epimerase
LTIESSSHSPAVILDRADRDTVTANNGHSHESPISRVDFPHEVILITGAGGSIGSALAKQIVGSKLDSANAGLAARSDQHARAQNGCAPSWQDAGPTVLLLDHSEQNLYEINSELSPGRDKQANHIAILGDVNDAALLDDIFEKYRPTTVFHAAAFKHVPLMEENPIAVIRNNILGTWTLATTAAQYRAHQLTMISTDKAANPRSIMGAAKRVAEFILTRLDTPATRMRSIRLGNVLGSTGSVVPLFQRQIESGGPVTVTHPDARRYFLSLDEATDLILAAAVLEDAATLFVPDLAAPIKILDLAKKLISEAHESDAAGANPIEIVFTGLRPGDKLSEDLLSSSEFAEPTNHPRLRRITGPTPTAKSLDAAITLISENVQVRALPALFDAIRALVRDYEPSDLISAQISPHLSITAKA